PRPADRLDARRPYARVRRPYLVQARERLDGQAVRPGENLGGRRGTGQPAGVDGINRLAREARGGRLGLADAEPGQRWVCTLLGRTVGERDRLTVPDEDD